MKCENCKYWHYLGNDPIINKRYGVCCSNPKFEDVWSYFDDRCSSFLINHNNDLKEEEENNEM